MSFILNGRITLESVPLADALWRRLRPWLSDITIDGDHRRQHIHGIQFLLQGRWTNLGLNPMFRLCKYFPGGHFAPHFDGFFVRSSHSARCRPSCSTSTGTLTAAAPILWTKSRDYIRYGETVHSGSVLTE
ncbi:hypothetical protein ACOMHN_051845 [Nucella lapillus]